MSPTEHELVDIRRTVERHLDRVGLWYVPTTSRSTSGGTTVSYPANPTRSTPVRIAPMDKKIEAKFADRLGGRQGWTATAPYGVPVPVLARLVVGSRTFEVLGTDSGMSYPGATRVPLVELT